LIAPAPLPVAGSLLFVPGDRADRVPKALATTANIVCIDLEDSVAPDRKAVAIQTILEALADPAVRPFAVRINSVRTRQGLADVLALASAPRPPSLVMMPKVESAGELFVVAGAFEQAGVGLLPQIETLEGLSNLPAIARAPQCAGAMLGGVDFANDIGAAFSWDGLLLARHEFIRGCAHARIAALDVPYLALDDEAGLREEASKAKALGFTGKAAIHPKQLDVMAQVFAPSAAEIEEAQAALAAFKAAKGAVVRFQGKMLEAPIVKRYERILVAAGL
jgi:citrate lyase beta subunit